MPAQAVDRLARRFPTARADVPEVPGFAEAVLAAAVATAPEPDSEALLDALEVLGAARAGLDDLEALLLVTAREQRVSWERIRVAQGFRSLQAAEQRYRRLVEQLHGANLAEGRARRRDELRMAEAYAAGRDVGGLIDQFVDALQGTPTSRPERLWAPRLRQLVDRGDVGPALVQAAELAARLLRRPDALTDTLADASSRVRDAHDAAVRRPDQEHDQQHD